MGFLEAFKFGVSAHPEPCSSARCSVVLGLRCYVHRPSNEGEPEATYCGEAIPAVSGGGAVIISGERR
jgi:hypothetical protein